MLHTPALLDVHDAHGVGEARALLPASDHHHAVAHVRHPVVRSLHGVVDGEDAAVQVALARHLAIARDGDDGAARPVLGDQVRGAARGGDHDDGGGQCLEGRLHRSDCGGVGAVRDGGHSLAELGEQLLVPDSGLRLSGDVAHGLDADLRVVALRRLSAQHHAVSSFEDSVADVAHLSPRRSRLLHHRLQHLSGADDGLADLVALCNDHLLRDKNFFSGNFNAEIATGDHDAVRLLDDLVDIVAALVVLDLTDDLDLLALFAQHLTDLSDASRVTDEGSKDHVDLLLHAEHQVSLILLRHSGKVHGYSGQIHALLAAQHASILYGAVEEVCSDLVADQRDQAVINKDLVAGLDNFADVKVVDVHNILRALLNEGLVRGQLDLGSLHKLHLSGSPTFQEASPDLGSLGVESNSDGAGVAHLLRELLSGRSHVAHGLSVVLVGAVTEVHASNVHADLHHADKCVHGARDGPNGADDAREAHTEGHGVDIERSLLVDICAGLSGMQLHGRHGRHRCFKVLLSAKNKM